MYLKKKNNVYTIGPVSFVINAAGLTTATPGNLVHKYADDTYVVIPDCNVLSRADELKHVALWAQANNLKLNGAKTVGHFHRQQTQATAMPSI